MNRGHYHQKIHYYLALIIAFSLPLGKLTPIFITLMFLNWLIEGDFNNKFKIILHNKFTLLFVLFYTLHIVGLLYTQNKNDGLFNLQVKLSILLFPLLITSRPFSASNVKYVFFALIAGGMLSSIIMLSRSIYFYIANNENYFFYQTFSILMHPSYLSMYLNVSIAWLLINITSNQSLGKSIPILFSIFIIAFLSFIIILLSSKAGIITLLLIYIVFLFYNVFYKKRNIIGVIGVILLLLSVSLVFRFAPKVTGRVYELIEAVKNENNNQTIESSSVRLLIWNVANSLISKNFLFGVGTGDVKDELKKEYSKRNMTGAFANELNAHNQFYQIFMSLGIIGFLVLLVVLLFPMYFAIKTENYIYMAFLLIMIINFIPESMLETQAGTMFYGFFNSLLCFSKTQPKSYFNTQNL